MVFAEGIVGGAVREEGRSDAGSVGGSLGASTRSHFAT